MPPRIKHLDMNPDRLSWNNLTTVPNKIDGRHEAEAGYDAVPGDILFRPVRKGGQFTVELHPDFVITLRPTGEVWKDANRTTQLLRHEELHYYVGYVVARAALNEIYALRVSRADQIPGRVQELLDRHLTTLGAAIQKKYDKDTANSANASKQREWDRAMEDCIANPNATTLMGLAL